MERLHQSFESIADGLAEKGYAVVDNFLSPEEVSLILSSDDFRNSVLQFKKAGTGRGKQVNESIRGDYIHWIDKATASAETRAYLSKLELLIQWVNQTLFLSLKDYEVHMTSYPSGSFYKRHLDQFHSDDHRKLSAICYLNPNWKESEGGQLRMYLPGGSEDFFPLAGRFVCFRSDQIEHEVLPATRERLSITGWLLDQLSDLRNL